MYFHIEPFPTFQSIYPCREYTVMKKVYKTAGIINKWAFIPFPELMFHKKLNRDDNVLNPENISE
jgi:hypothetical protein